jgi:VWFA-related protein
MAFYNRQSKRGLRFPSRLVIAIRLFALCLVVLITTTRAQEPGDVVRVRTDLVAVPVIVMDPRGRRVSDLQPADFAVRDERGPLKIDYFASATERVALLFALDTSGSAREIIERQRTAALALFVRLGHGSRIAILHFGDLVQLTIPFTSNSEAALASFGVGARESQGTAIFDGAAAAVRSFDGSGGFSSERRIVILMSDGLDTLSSTSYQRVIDAARTRGVSFYVVHFPLFTPREGILVQRTPSKGFRELGEQTGGQYFRIGDAKSALDPHPKVDLAPVFQAIEHDLRGQYVLGFYPGESARDALTHKVEVKLTSPRHRKLKVQQLKSSYTLQDNNE